MVKLKDYDKQTAKKTLKGTIPSGIKSGDSEAEMMVVEPLIKHPEIAGLYRAVDPDTGWKGWVEYAPPTPPSSIPPELTPEQIKRGEYQDKLSELRKKKQLVDLGVIQDSSIDTLRAEVLALATDLGEI